MTNIKPKYKYTICAFLLITSPFILDFLKGNVSNNLVFSLGILFCLMFIAIIIMALIDNTVLYVMNKDFNEVTNGHYKINQKVKLKVIALNLLLFIFLFLVIFFFYKLR